MTVSRMITGETIMAKITLATVKSFIDKNRAGLLVLQESSFDGMTDCVQQTGVKTFAPAKPSFHSPCKNDMGMAGVWFVFGSHDYFTAHDDGLVFGYRVYNCCGSFTVGVLKQAIAA